MHTSKAQVKTTSFSTKIVGVIVVIFLVCFLLTIHFLTRNDTMLKDRNMNGVVPSEPITQTQLPRKSFGVNIAGAEFGEGNLPGIVNTHYIYPTSNDEYRYFAEKKLRLIRLPFRWERIQRVTMGELSVNDLAALRIAIERASENEQKVILDLHNFGRYYNAPLKKEDANEFADIWRRLADEFKDDPTIYGYELMNEPHDLPEGSDSWSFLAQEAVNAIREVDSTHYILVPGYDWQSAERWPESNPSLSIEDPYGKILYAAHLYFDRDHSGKYVKSYSEEGGYPTIGRDRLRPFITWLHEKKCARNYH